MSSVITDKMIDQFYGDGDFHKTPIGICESCGNEIYGSKIDTETGMIHDEADCRRIFIDEVWDCLTDSQKWDLLDNANLI